jgi:hypothetical protein
MHQSIQRKACIFIHLLFKKPQKTLLIVENQLFIVTIYSNGYSLFKNALHPFKTVLPGNSPDESELHLSRLMGLFKTNNSRLSLYLTHWV